MERERQGRHAKTQRQGRPRQGGRKPRADQRCPLLHPTAGFSQNRRESGQHREPWFCHGPSGVASYHRGHVTFLRRASGGPGPTRGEGFTQGREHWGASQRPPSPEAEGDMEKRGEKDPPQDFKSWQKEQAFHRRDQISNI